MAHTKEAIASWRGRNAVDSDGNRIGKIEQIYIDAETGKPEWLAVTTGLFGSKVSFIPIAETSKAGEDGGEVRVPYYKQQVKDAPNAEADGELSQEEEADLYRHYGLDYSEYHSDSGLPEGQQNARFGRRRSDHEAVGRDTSGPATDDAMTRSEDELRVGKASRERGRARLRKYVVTENVQKTVPVQREEGARRARAHHRRQRRRRQGRHPQAAQVRSGRCGATRGHRVPPTLFARRRWTGMRGLWGGFAGPLNLTVAPPHTARGPTTGARSRTHGAIRASAPTPSPGEGGGGRP